MNDPVYDDQVIVWNMKGEVLALVAARSIKIRIFQSKQQILMQSKINMYEFYTTMKDGNIGRITCHFSHSHFLLQRLNI